MRSILVAFAALTVTVPAGADSPQPMDEPMAVRVTHYNVREMHASDCSVDMSRWIARYGNDPYIWEEEFEGSCRPTMRACMLRFEERDWLPDWECGRGRRLTWLPNDFITQILDSAEEL